MERRLALTMLGASVWLFMAVWQLADLVGRLRDPHLAVDPARVALLLGCAVCAVPVGSLLGGLLAMLGRPAADPGVAVVSTLQTLTCSAAYGLVVSLGFTVTRPGSGLGIGLPLSATGAGLAFGLGVGISVVMVARGRSEQPAPAMSFETSR